MALFHAPKCFQMLKTFVISLLATNYSIIIFLRVFKVPHVRKYILISLRMSRKARTSHQLKADLCSPSPSILQGRSVNSCWSLRGPLQYQNHFPEKDSTLAVVFSVVWGSWLRTKNKVFVVHRVKQWKWKEERQYTKEVKVGDTHRIEAVMRSPNKEKPRMELLPLNSTWPLENRSNDSLSYPVK